MKQVLFIVTEYESANGICCRALMDEMAHSGKYQVFCITNREWGQAEEFGTGKIKVFTIKPRLVYRALSMLNKSDIQGLKRKLLTYSTKILNKIQLFMSVPTWPLISPLYANAFYKKARELCVSEKIDVIVPIFSQIDPLIAARKLKQEFPNIKYVPYFLDSLSGGYGPKVFSQEWLLRRGRKWEDKLLPLADSIIMMESNRAHCERHCAEAEYYDRIIFLDIPLFVPQVLKEQNVMSRHLLSDKINILYIGAIPIQARNPQFFFDVFRQLENDNLHLTIMGSNNCPKLMTEACDNDCRITLLPPVSHDEAIYSLHSADFLLNIGNNNPRMTPSKIFEYMAQGKPIISTAPIADEPSLKYLKKYPLALVLYEHEGPTAAAEKLKLFIEDCRNTEAKICGLEETFRSNLPRTFVEHIENLQ